MIGPLALLLAACLPSPEAPPPAEPTRADPPPAATDADAAPAEPPSPDPRPAVSPPAAVPSTDVAPERAAALLGELALLGQPAPPLPGLPRAAEQAAVVFLAEPDAEARAAVRALAARLSADAPDVDRVVVLARGDGASAPEGFRVVPDPDGAHARAWRRSAPVSAALVRDGRVAWTGSVRALDAAVLARHR